MTGETGYIVAAYAVAALVICALVGAILWDYRTQRRALARLEKHTGTDAPMMDAPTTDLPMADAS